MQVRFEPIGEVIECEAGETVLDAAFRQGLNLVHGCREGQCSACKCFLLEGDAALERYSNFALSDSERAGGYSLMCRAVPEGDVVVELLHFDPDNLRLEHPIADGVATVADVEPLTHDITRLVLDAPGFRFTPGQYVDLHIPGEAGARRAFSMANLPGEDRIELVIKRYPGGRFSGMLDGTIRPGETIGYTGPYGSLRMRPGDRPVLMVAGGSGMAPILSLLRELAAARSERPIRFFYGARTDADLFLLDEIAALSDQLTDFAFTPVTGRFVHEAVDEFLHAGQGGKSGGSPAQLEVYMCGPPPMLEAAEEMLIATHGVDERRIHQDRFTPSADSAVPAETGAAAAGQPPVKVVRDGGVAASGLVAESERTFTWYTPQKRRATLYEDVTVDTQPSVHRHVRRGWSVRFADGRGTWDDDSTRLRSTDWFAFRDPGEQWERTYYQLGNASEQQIEGAIRSAAADGLLADFDPDWVEFLRAALQVPAYVEHGLWYVTATVARDCLSDTVSHCVAIQAAMKQRSAQSIVLYAMDLEATHGDFAIEPARRAFLEEPAWQPTRRYLERLAATRDWGEVLIAANLCFEPLVGTLLRRELGLRAAVRNGDTVTPVLARVAGQEWEWVRAWTAALVRFLVDDPVHAEANRATVERWVVEWTPLAEAALAALAPVAERVPRGIDLVEAVAALTTGRDRLLAEVGLFTGEPAGAASGVPDAPAPAAPARRVRSGPVRRSKVARPEADAVAAGAAAPAGALPVEAGTDGAYDFVGIVMAKSAEGDAVAAILAERPGIRVYEQPAFWDIRAEGRMVIPYADVSERLGYEIDAYSIQHEMSTHYGRMVATDESLMLFSDPTEAMQYLMA